MRRLPKHRSTPHGEHRPVLLDEVLRILDPRPGMVVVDCTVGWAGHSAELLKIIGPTGLLLALDMDAENLPKAKERLDALGHPCHLHHSNFAGLQQVLAEHGLTQVDALLADLGMSSMQVDDPERGFSYVRAGTLDMRMDRSRGRTAAQILATISKAELSEALKTWGDEPAANRIASAIVEARGQTSIITTKQLADIIQSAANQESWRLHPSPGKWVLHPAARTFQALRLLVNRELANLEHLLRLLPLSLKPGGHAGVISFHSGEDRLVMAAFRAGLEAGVYAAISTDPVRASWNERTQNPRSRLRQTSLGRTFAYTLVQDKVGSRGHGCPLITSDYI